MGGLAQILLSLGGHALAKVIGAKFGADMGELAKQALEALGQVFEVEPKPDVIEKRIRDVAASEPAKAQEAVGYAEADFAPRLLAYAEVLKAANEQQRQTNDLLNSEQEQGGLAAAWLWLWQYLLMALWSWAIVFVHLVNAAARAVGGAGVVPLPSPDLAILMTLTGAYLALHMGGHTVLELMRGGTFGGRKGTDA